MAKARFRNYGCRIRDDIVYKGMRSIFMENNFIRVGILVDKGTDIFEFLYKPHDIDIVWLSPFGIKSPFDYILTKNQVGGRFIDYYEGGWQEVFPNGGPPCKYKGAELGQHDEVSLIPWDYEIIKDSVECIEVKFWVNTRLTPFSIEKNVIIRNNNPELLISEKVINRSQIEMEAIWGHHIVYGYPFLTEGCEIEISAKKGLTYDVKGVIDDNIETGYEFNWPILDTKDNQKIDLSIIPQDNRKTSKFIYLYGLDRGEYEIKNKEKKLKVRVCWDNKVMPYVWYWQEFNKTESYPWYKMVRVFGLEPFSADIMGLDNAVREEKALTIKGNSELRFFINVSVLEI